MQVVTKLYSLFQICFSFSGVQVLFVSHLPRFVSFCAT